MPDLFVEIEGVQVPVDPEKAVASVLRCVDALQYVRNWRFDNMETLTPTTLCQLGVLEDILLGNPVA